MRERHFPMNLAIEGANHADYQFFQRETWQRIINFFHGKLGYAR